MQQDNVKHAKHLLERIIKNGKRSEKLEAHVDMQLRKEVKAEKKLSENDDIAEPKDDADEEEPDPLKKMLAGFWATFDDYEKEFDGKVREHLKDGHPIQAQLQELYKKILADDPISEYDASLE